MSVRPASDGPLDGRDAALAVAPWHAAIAIALLGAAAVARIAATPRRIPPGTPLPPPGMIAIATEPTSVAPFFLDESEVSNEQFAQMLTTIAQNLVVDDDQDHHVPRYVRRADLISPPRLLDLNTDHGGIEHVAPFGYRARQGYDRLPVVQVSWYGAKLYCEAMGKRLATADEWETATRGRDLANHVSEWMSDVSRINLSPSAMAANLGFRCAADAINVIDEQP